MLLMIFLSLSAGYIVKTLQERNAIAIPFPLEGIRRFLQKLSLIGFVPVTVTTSVWIAPISDVQILALPFIGLFALASGSLAAIAFTRPLGLNRKQKAVFFISGGFSNLGSLGSLVSFILLGEKGFALVSFYILFERIWYFGVGFPYGRKHSMAGGEKETGLSAVRLIFLDPFVLTTLLSMAAGIILNITGVPRPSLFAAVNSTLVPLGTILLLVSIGMGMRLSKVGIYLKHGLVIVLIKTLLIPLLTVSLAALLGMGNLSGGLPLQVILILSAMPVGFTALVPPSIYDLDLDMANSCWLISNAALLLTIPMLSLLVPLI